MTDKQTETMYSTNDEMFTHNDVEEVLVELQDIDKLEVGAVYYSCEFKSIDVASVAANESMERLDEYLSEAVGECYDRECVYIGKEALSELKELFRDFLKKHTHLMRTNFYEPVGKSSIHHVTQEQVDSFK